MITLPDDAGFRRSVKVHNVELVPFCDWIEASVVFDERTDRVSKSDIVDVLCEGNIYDEQDFAAQRVDDAWLMLRNRQKWLHSGSPFIVEQKHIKRVVPWADVPAHSFCIMLSLACIHREWARMFGPDYNAQGVLFERLTCASLKALGWSVVRTGWSAGTTKKITKVIRKVSSHIKTPRNTSAQRFVGKRDNDGGLDVVCLKRFIDYDTRPGGAPVCLMQCASGRDWSNKLHNPSIEQWGKIISFSTSPIRGLSIPFHLCDNDFLPTCAKVNGLVFDRYRILSASGAKRGWLPKKLAADIVAWISQRVKVLPFA